MVDILNNELKEGDTVLFPGGRELMFGTVVKIRQIGRKQPEAYIENESGYKKWKNSIALIKIEKDVTC